MSGWKTCRLPNFGLHSGVVLCGFVKALVVDEAFLVAVHVTVRQAMGCTHRAFLSDTGGVLGWAGEGDSMVSCG